MILIDQSIEVFLLRAELILLYISLHNFFLCQGAQDNYKIVYVRRVCAWDCAYLIPDFKTFLNNANAQERAPITRPLKIDIIPMDEQ